MYPRNILNSVTTETIRVKMYKGEIFQDSMPIKKIYQKKMICQYDRITYKYDQRTV